MPQKPIVETLEARVLMAAETAGADVAFTTYEAESAVVGGGATKVVMSGFPSSTTIDPETEASGRGLALLDATGEYVEFQNVVATNTIVVRHSIPDAPGGGGLTGTLALYVDGVFRQSLSMSSKYNWLYNDGTTAGINGQTNIPTAFPHVYWDEDRYFISGEAVSAGSTIRLQKTSADTASYYRIDLVEMEVAPEPLAPPAAGTYLSVADYGANGTDLTNDAPAIQACINAAKTQGKTVWIPAGTYYQDGKFTNLAGVTVQGAGMWRTNIIGTTIGGGFNGTLGFNLDNGTKVRDLYIAGTAHTSRPDEGAKVFTSAATTSRTGWQVENVWITRVVCGFWVIATDAVVRGNRVRFTYADAINLNHGPVNSLVEQNHVRGAGDDGIALLSESRYVNQMAANTTVRHNTVVANWAGHNMDYAGGGGNVFEYNYLADSAWSGAFTISLSGAFPMHPITSGAFQFNTIVRGGGNKAGQNRGALWLYPGSTTIENMVISDNQILDSIYHGIHLVATFSQQYTFERNVISKPGKHGIRVDSTVVGSAVFNDNTVTNVSTGSSQFSQASANFTWTGTGNSWQPDTTSPLLTGMAIDDGTEQRSMVRTLTLVFSEPVLLADGMVSLEPYRVSGASGTFVHLTNLGDGRNWQLSFSGPAVVASSLPDGIYGLNLAAGEIKDPAGNALVPVVVPRFHRLFGDMDGDRQVSGTELLLMKKAMHTYDVYLDFDGDGRIDGQDLMNFKARQTRRIV